MTYTDIIIFLDFLESHERFKNIDTKALREALVEFTVFNNLEDILFDSELYKLACNSTAPDKVIDDAVYTLFSVIYSLVKDANKGRGDKYE